MNAGNGGGANADKFILKRDGDMQASRDGCGLKPGMGQGSSSRVATIERETATLNRINTDNRGAAVLDNLSLGWLKRLLE